MKDKILQDIDIETFDFDPDEPGVFSIELIHKNPSGDDLREVYEIKAINLKEALKRAEKQFKAKITEYHKVPYDIEDKTLGFIRARPFRQFWRADKTVKRSVANSFTIKGHYQPGDLLQSSVNTIKSKLAPNPEQWFDSEDRTAEERESIRQRNITITSISLLVSIAVVVLGLISIYAGSQGLGSNSIIHRFGSPVSYFSLVGLLTVILGCLYTFRFYITLSHLQKER